MAAAEPPKSKGQSKLRTQLNEEDLRRAYQAAKKVADEHDVKVRVLCAAMCVCPCERPCG